VVFDCGGRTPLQDEELFGTPGLVSNGGTSVLTTSGGTGGTTSVGSAGSSAAGSSVGIGGTGIGGSIGIGGFGTGAGGSTVIGAGGSTGFGGTGAAGSIGVAGSTGVAGSLGMGGAIGAGGSVGAAGAGGGPNQVRRLIMDLPGTRATADCLGCASMCPGSEQCAANAACMNTIDCASANCIMRNGNPGLPCLAMCAGGNTQALAQAIEAVACVYGTCGRQCRR
jgi:hypothetical protein